MSILITESSSEVSNRSSLLKHLRRQVGFLCGLLLAFFALYLVMAFIAVPLGAPVKVFATFMAVWGACFGLYFIASYWVLMTTPPLHGRWLWVELGLILAGAVIFRFMLVNLPLGLSGDAWRYLWDARVTLHGYSPYIYAPFDKILIPLHDSVLAHSSYRQFPTKYPPGAQIFFILGYLLNPTNLVALKTLFVLLDLITCIALTALLVRKGLDPRRVILYAWCPLPIIEFAIQSHSDVIAITFMVLALLCAQSSRKSLRIVAGVCIGMATLARLYPILLLLVLVRRRDWSLIVACFTTILLGYLPFILLGHGDIRSVLLSFSGQQDLHPGVLAMAPLYLASEIGHRVDLPQLLSVTHKLEMVVVGITALVICIQRLRKRISEEAGLLTLIAVVLMAYAHIFPWYMTALLPWIAMVAVPVWTREKGINAKGLAALMVWYFNFIVTGSYILAYGQYATQSNWLIYYAVSFGVMVLGLTAAIMIWFLRHRSDLEASLYMKLSRPSKNRLSIPVRQSQKH